ncbi:c-type cytochrome [Mucilaginibacter sp. BJC16-A38]|uniref:c-type cytochrome n=1 Tax=Mucilaginibacter phenanthrenivorans TaxID=1234842 RepID=UPI00215858D3|nr:c-type cytochrome [Mucilaginibacter phenanthrenivorans]MCR8556601.1 c-type cytochrome [Mucilaginibacter phenanthrenivorans]
MNKLITAILYVTFIAFASHSSAQVKKKGIIKKKVTPAAAKEIPPPPPFATPAELEDGKALIAKSDCLACHKIDTKLVGPAYIAVAEKYPQDQNTVNLLSQRVISGGKGVWGPVPMAPHPTITPEDANKIVKYILTLNSKSPPLNSK